MHILFSRPIPGERTSIFARRDRPVWWRAALALTLASLLSSMGHGRTAKAARTAEEAFGADVELAPFVVRGEQLAISIHARSARDRKYAQKFAEQVVKDVYNGVTERTGKGLVIMGAKGEPHPMTVFRKFQAMAAAGELEPGLTTASAELTSFLEGLKAAMHHGESQQTDEFGDVDFDFDRVIQALPLPLEGVAAQLYQIAWAERFDEAKLTARLRSLKAEDLTRDMFVTFDWVFYMPQRGALDRVLNDLIAQALKESDMGFFTRAAAKTVLTIAKPFIRRAVEGMRQGVLFLTVVRAQTDYNDSQVAALVEAYIEALMPGSPVKGHGSGHDRAVWAVRDAAERFGSDTQFAEVSDSPEDGDSLGDAFFDLDSAETSDAVD